MRTKLWLWASLVVAGCSGGAGSVKPQPAGSATPAKTETKAEAKPSGPYAIQLGGRFIPLNSYRYMHNGIPILYGEVPTIQRKVVAMELLIKRELLAAAAAKLNFSVFDKTVRESIEAGDLYLLGNKLDGKKIYFEENDGALEFEPLYLERFVLGRLQLPSMASFEHEQRREQMAQFMRERIEKSETVSEKEVRDHYIAKNAKLSAEFVNFDIRHYQSQLRLTRVMVQSYVDTHEEQLKAEWHNTKPRWQSDKERIELSILKVDRRGAIPKVALKKIRDARAMIRKASEFGAIAGAMSQDRSADLGGYVGWRAAQSIGYGQEVVDASKGLAVGEVSEVIETPSAYYLVRIHNRTNKGLLFEQMKFTLAMKMAPRSIARERARKAATEALASSRPLAKQFPLNKQEAVGLDNLPAEILEQLTPAQREALGAKSSSFVMSGPPSLYHAKGILRDQDFVSGVGYAKKLVKALWGDVKVGAMVLAVYQVASGEAFAIARLTERTEADMEAFTKEAAALKKSLSEAKHEKAVQAWVRAACRELVESNAAVPNPDVLGLNAAGKALRYEPCSMLSED